MTIQNGRGADVAPPAVPQPPGFPTPAEAPAAPTVPYVPPPIPQGGGRLIIDEQGDRTVYTTTELPPTMMSAIVMAKDVAIGFGVLLAIIIIVGPFARMLARRMERKPELEATTRHNEVLQQQIQELQQSIDAMSVEVERISESQRFQSKLLYEKRAESSIPS